MKKNYSIIAIMSSLFLGFFSNDSFGAERELNKNLIDRAIMPRKGMLHVGTFINIFNTAANFDKDGKNSIPKELVTYINYKGGVFGQYIIDDGLGVMAGINYDYKISESTPTGHTQDIVKSNHFGLSELTLSGKFNVVNKKKIALTIVPTLMSPVYSNTNINVSKHELPLGDGSVDFTIAGLTDIELFDDFFFDVMFGYKYRSQGFSAELPYRANFLYAGKLFYAYAGLIGNLSLKGDKFTQNPENRVQLTSKSYVFDAVNPEAMSISAGASFDVTSWLSINGKYEKTIAGKNTANAQIFGLGITINDQVGTFRKSTADELKKFNTYTITAKIVKTSKALSFVKIDKGLDDDVNEGDTFDIFTVNTLGETDKLLARGKIQKVEGNSAVLKIEKYFKEVLIDETHIAKKLIKSVE